MRSRRHSAWYRSTAVLMVTPTVLYLLGLSIYPLFNSLYLSFNEWSLTSPKPPRFIWFDNFVSLFADDRFWNALRVTIEFTAVVVLVEMSFGLILALLASKNTAIIRFSRSIILIPMMITPVVIGLIWKYMFNPENGIINYFAGLVGINGPLWLGDPAPALPAIMIVDVWQWTPFVFLILSAGLASLPQDVFEAARVDGASGVQTFRFVTVPLLIPFMIVALLVRFIDSFKIFDLIYVMTEGGPANATEALSIYTYKVGLNFFHMGYASALSYIILIIITLASQLFVRLEKTDRVR